MPSVAPLRLKDEWVGAWAGGANVRCLEGAPGVFALLVLKASCAHTPAACSCNR